MTFLFFKNSYILLLFKSNNLLIKKFNESFQYYFFIFNWIAAGVLR